MNTDVAELKASFPKSGGGLLITSSGGLGFLTRAPGDYGETTSTYLISAEVETPTLVGTA